MNNEIEIEQELCITNLKTLNILFSEQDGSDAVSLYFFYIKNAKIQKTSSVWNTKPFCMKGLGRGDKRFDRAKSILKKYNLIEDIKDIDEITKKIKGRYIKIKYHYKTTPPQTPPSGSIHPVATEGTNTIYNKKKCLIQKKEKNTFIPYDTEKEQKATKEVNDYIEQNNLTLSDQDKTKYRMYCDFVGRGYYEGNRDEFFKKMEKKKVVMQVEKINWIDLRAKMHNMFDRLEGKNIRSEKIRTQINTFINKK